MLSYQTKLQARRTIKKTFQLINDLVVPTMGAKGMMVAIKDGFGKGTITDDGVTVAKEGTKLDGFEQMIAVDMIEAAGNTEKEALDGTTLTILLTNEICFALISIHLLTDKLVLANSTIAPCGEPTSNQCFS